jgi:hypothetical protein
MNLFFIKSDRREPSSNSYNHSYCRPLIIQNFIEICWAASETNHGNGDTAFQALGAKSTWIFEKRADAKFACLDNFQRSRRNLLWYTETLEYKSGNPPIYFFFLFACVLYVSIPLLSIHFLGYVAAWQPCSPPFCNTASYEVQVQI